MTETQTNKADRQSSTVTAASREILADTIIHALQEKARKAKPVWSDLDREIL